MAALAPHPHHSQVPHDIEKILEGEPGSGSVAMNAFGGRLALTYCPACLRQLVYARWADGTLSMAVIDWERI